MLAELKDRKLPEIVIQDNKSRVTAEETIRQLLGSVVCLFQYVAAYDNDYNDDHDATIPNRKRTYIFCYNYSTTTNEYVKKIVFEEMTKYIELMQRLTIRGIRMKPYNEKMGSVIPGNRTNHLR
jgi:hypothetical protein